MNNIPVRTQFEVGLYLGVIARQSLEVVPWASLERA